MYEILPAMIEKPRASMKDQIIRTDLLYGILVVDTGMKVQYKKIYMNEEWILILNLSIFIIILKPSLVQIYHL